MKVLIVTLLVSLLVIGCKTDKSYEPISLDRALSLAYESGVDINIRYRHRRQCQDVIEVDWYHVPRNQAASERALRSLDLVYQALQATPDHCPRALNFLAEIRRDMRFDFQSLNRENPRRKGRSEREESRNRR